MQLRYRVSLFVVIVSLLAMTSLFAQNARIQLIHNSGDIDAFEMGITVDGDSLTTLDFRTATPFMDMAAGSHDFEFTVQDPAGAGDVIVGPQTVTLDAGMTYVGIIDGITPLNLDRDAYVEPAGRDVGLTLLPLANARESANASNMVEFIIHHGSTDAPAVDVIANSTITLADSIDYSETTDYIPVPPAVFTLDVTPGDDNTTVVATFEADLSGLAGMTAVISASGFLTPGDNQGAPKLALLVALADGTTLVLEDQTIGPVGDWEFAGISDYVFLDFFGADTLVQGGHGVQVDKFDRIWVCNFRAGLTIVDPDGTPAPFSPINELTIGTTTVTMDNCRGLEEDLDGNIIFVQSGGGAGGHVVRINAETGEGMQVFAEGQSLLKAGVDQNGFVYTGRVVGINPIKVLEPGFFTATQEITLENPPGFGRGLAVTADGLTIFTPDLAGSGAPLRIWTSADGGLTYSQTDSVWTNTDGAQIFNTNLQTFDWGPDSTLWVSVDNAVNASDANQLVILDFDTQTYQTVAFPLVDENADLTNGPRGVSFSATNDTAYVAIWEPGNRMARFVRNLLSVDERPIVPSGYALEQNYPNPFNPTTTIGFRVPQLGPVTLKVYNTLGQEVAVMLDNQIVPAGFHEVPFDGTKLASGIYYYELNANGKILTQKMTLTK